MIGLPQLYLTHLGFNERKKENLCIATIEKRMKVSINITFLSSFISGFFLMLLCFLDVWITLIVEQSLISDSCTCMCVYININYMIMDIDIRSTQKEGSEGVEHILYV